MVKLVNVTEIFIRQNRLVPDFVHFNLTYRCNLRCIYCLDDLTCQDELSFQEVLSIIDQLADLGVLEITFTGGEPFLRDDLPKVTNHAFKRGFKVRILTNGTLITGKVLNRFLRPDLLSFTLNLLGSNPTVHDRITQVPGSFERISRAIKLLKRRNIQTDVTTVVLRENFEDIGNIKSLCDRFSISFGTQVNIRPTWGGDTSPLRHQISIDQQKELIIKGLYGQRFNKRYKRLTRGLCNLGYLNPAIGADGKLYPCNILRMEAGDLRKESFLHIWYNSPVLKMLRSIKRQNYKCSTCRYFACCIPCVADTYLQKGHINEVPPGRCQTGKLAYTLQAAQ
jgi:radical SAM protein with 4Fe4S-binding SPASM domain